MAALMDPGQHARSASYVDPVATWKEAALERARLAARDQQAAQQPYVRLRVTFGFLLAAGLTLLLALRSGMDGAASVLLVLPSVLLVQELPRAWLARCRGRSSATGAQVYRETLDEQTGVAQIARQAEHHVRGDDLSRRPVAHGCKLLEASDDRRAAAMLRACHPVVAANVLSSCEPARAQREKREAVWLPADARLSRAIETLRPTRCLTAGELQGTSVESMALVKQSARETPASLVGAESHNRPTLDGRSLASAHGGGAHRRLLRAAEAVIR